jgi:hypothetical protein
MKNDKRLRRFREVSKKQRLNSLENKQIREKY